MNEPFGMYVSDNRGALHSGKGDLIQNYYYGLTTGAIEKELRKQAEDECWWLERRFVHPQGFGRARKILAAYRTVFLNASRGSGRTAAAKMLLWELRRDTKGLHELVPDERGSDQRLDLNRIGDGDRMWLNLAYADLTLWNKIQAQFSQLRAVVHERTAHLVVVLPPEVEDLQPAFHPYRAQISRPHGDEVLRSYLRVGGIPHPDPLPSLPFLTVHRSPKAIANYAQRIGEEQNRAPGDDFVTWCAAADRARSGHAEEVADLVGKLHQGSQRALLIATAMLHGAYADRVHRAATSLMEAVEHPHHGRPVLLHTTLDRRLQNIDAEIDDSGQVRFKKYDYDSVVRKYVWGHMPELHKHIKKWVCTTVASLDLTDTERDDLVSRFVEQCGADRHRPMLTWLVEEWTKSSATSREVRAAARVLARGLRDESLGRFFRRQVYDWSCRSNLEDRLAELIIVACRTEMAVSHPDEAVVRLHHLARREREPGRAREALIDMVRSDLRFLRQMLKRLTDSSTERWPVDIDLFLELADPVTLTDPGTHGRTLVAEPAVRRQLAKGWRLAFTQTSSHPAWFSQARAWLLAAVRDERHRHVLLDVLVEGGGQHTGTLARLYTMTREPELRAISDLIRQKSDAAQGLQFT